MRCRAGRQGRAVPVMEHLATTCTGGEPGDAVGVPRTGLQGAVVGSSGSTHKRRRRRRRLAGGERRGGAGEGGRGSTEAAGTELDSRGRPEGGSCGRRRRTEAAGRRGGPEK